MSTPLDASGAAGSSAIDSLQQETRRFPPPAEFAADAAATAGLAEQAAADRLAFWADRSRELLHWHRPFTRTLPLPETCRPFT